MSTPLLVKLRSAAITNSALTTALGTTPFRWYDTQLDQGSAYPAIVALIVSSPKKETLVGINPTAFYRVQFTIWEGTTPDTADVVLDALRAFLAGFTGTTRAPNFSPIIMERRGFFAPIQPGVYQTIVDAMVPNDDTT